MESSSGEPIVIAAGAGDEAAQAQPTRRPPGGSSSDGAAQLGAGTAAAAAPAAGAAGEPVEPVVVLTATAAGALPAGGSRPASGSAANDADRQAEARAALLATRPLGEQLTETVANLKLKSQLPAAVRHVLRLMDGGHSADVAAHPEVIPLLGKAIADGPALPAAGGAMAALARMCVVPDTRARVRAEVPLAPVVRYLSLADPAGELGAPNAEPAALLIANAAADALARRALVAAGAVEGLVGLLQRFTDLSSLLACHMAAALVALVAMAEPGSGAQRRFVQAGGVEAACQALAAWPRADGGKGPLRLRLLLSEVASADSTYEARVLAAAGAHAPAGGSCERSSLRTAGVAALAAVRAAVGGSSSSGSNVGADGAGGGGASGMMLSMPGATAGVANAAASS